VAGTKQCSLYSACVPGLGFAGARAPSLVSFSCPTSLPVLSHRIHEWLRGCGERCRAHTRQMRSKSKPVMNYKHTRACHYTPCCALACATRCLPSLQQWALTQPRGSNLNSLNKSNPVKCHARPPPNPILALPSIRPTPCCRVWARLPHSCTIAGAEISSADISRPDPSSFIQQPSGLYKLIQSQGLQKQPFSDRRRSCRSSPTV